MSTSHHMAAAEATLEKLRAATQADVPPPAAQPASQRARLFHAFLVLGVAEPEQLSFAHTRRWFRFGGLIQG